MSGTISTPVSLHDLDRKNFILNFAASQKVHVFEKIIGCI
jgi:hypothetical protein